jgi:hypothetical protein
MAELGRFHLPLFVPVEVLDILCADQEAAYDWWTEMAEELPEVLAVAGARPFGTWEWTIVPGEDADVVEKTGEPASGVFIVGSVDAFHVTPSRVGDPLPPLGNATAFGFGVDR